MLQSTRVQRVGHNLITEEQRNHFSALSSRFYLADSLVCSLSFHDYSVLPVMSRVCSVAHVLLDLLKSQSQCVLAPQQVGQVQLGFVSLCTLCILLLL